ncbi:MAG: GAF domain-containing sensor histidine kinase, partial [Bacteroidales bacterium]|nr:GAF domain-containing sensor histidine kinase [Bacteroidales bacterium]
FTDKGSFWTNGTTRLLAETPPQQLEGTRNECNSSGYESVALVPIKSKGVNIGLLQLNDRREGMFTEELIEFLQMIGEQVGLAVENSMIYDRLQAQKKELEEHLEELKRTQNQLVEARKNSCLGSLVAGVSHELNTPVSNALMGIHILIDDGLKVFDKLRGQDLTENDLELYLNNHNELTQIILRNIEHISELTKSFKQTALSQVKEEKVMFKLKSFLYDIIASIKPTIKTKKIDFELDIEDHLEVKSYPGLFFQIFTNLIMNSFVHGFENKKDGTITIGGKTLNGGYSLFYQDDGKGISNELFPKVLEPFVTSKKSSCTGLGLSIVNNIITNNLKGELEYGNNKELGVFFKMQIPK